MSILNTINLAGYSILTGAAMPQWVEPLPAPTPLWWTELGWEETDEAAVVWAPRRPLTHTKWVNRAERFAECSRTHCQSKSKAKWLRKGRA